MGRSFYQGKKVFITGHTGFKGSWLSVVLADAGASVCGYSLAPDTSPNLFSLSGIENRIQSVIGDVRDLEHLKQTMMDFQPEIVLHLAAQPIVRTSYVNPVYTYETNVMGTVHVLEAVRYCPSVRSVVNVTTDKVYHNNEWHWGYRETDVLDGYDPYSNSKSCSELVTSAYKNSFLNESGIAVSTARAGNVIGGGDFAPDRIIPDCVRSVLSGESIRVRNPYSIRPYQHVLEPIFAYLLLAEKQYQFFQLSGSYNIGPEDQDCVTTGQLTDLFCRQWGEGAGWENLSVDGPHEANFLKLDCSKAKTNLDWHPHWHIEQAIIRTIEWTKCYRDHEDVHECMIRQIREYTGE